MWGIVGYVLKFKPMIFFCKAQAHALEFPWLAWEFLTANKTLNHLIFPYKHCPPHLSLFCRKYIVATSMGKEISFIFAFSFFTLIIFSYFLFLEL